MAWWDDLISFVKPAAETAWSFAKENPTLTGAGLGLLTGGGTGDYGSNNLRNTAMGGALGYGAGQMFGGGTPQVQSAGMSGPMSSPSWSPTSIGNPNAFSTSVSNAVPVSGAEQYFGASVGDGFSSMGGGFAQGASGMGDLEAGMKKVSDFGKKYQTPLKLGVQGLATLDKRQRIQDTEGMLRGQVAQEAARNAELQGLDAADRKTIDDSNAAERAYSAMAPKNAYSNVMNATGRAVRSAGMDPNQTATQRAARQRTLSLAGTTGATTAAANASRQPTLKAYGSPRATSNAAANSAANYGAMADSDLWKDYAALGQTAFGWDDAARKQVNP